MLAIGLDYGTTNSLITIYQDLMHLPNVAKIHKSSSVNDGEAFIRSPKRMLCNLRNNDKEAITRYINECVMGLFRELKEEYPNLNYSDIRLTITVPNAFKDEQCIFMKSAIAKASKLFFSDAISEEAIEIIPEPIAAALYYAYSMGQNLTDRQYVLVSDIGGGTTDLAVVRVEKTYNGLKFKVICTEHDALLGGDDIDLCIYEKFARKFNLRESKDLMNACRFLKERLSYTGYESIQLLHEDSTPYVIGGEEIELSLEKPELEAILKNASIRGGASFLTRFNGKLNSLKENFKQQLINEEKYGESDVENVLRNKTVILPVGGTSRIPLLQEQMRLSFGAASVFTLNTEDDSSSCGSDMSKFDSVSRGAAIYSAYSARMIRRYRKIEIENRTLHNISIRYAGDKVYTCVPKNMPDSDGYKAVFTPKAFLEDGSSISLNKLQVCQGGDGEYIDSDTEMMAPIELPDVIKTYGKSLEDIKIHVTTKIEKGRASRITIHIPDIVGGDYTKVIDL